MTEISTSDHKRPAGGTFADRLRHVLSGRKITPWARNLGISSGTRDRLLLNDGIPPTHESLARVMHTENVSLSWLLGAAGSPYLVSHTVDDADTANLLRAHMADLDNWEVVVLGGDNLRAILLHSEAQIDHHKGTIHYTAIEVIAGPIGPLTVKTLHQISPHGIKTRNLGRDTMRGLYAGNLGTYHLVGGDAKSGLIEPGKIYREDVGPLDLLPIGRLAEIRADYAATMTQRFAQAWPRLQDSEREIMARLLTPLLEHVTRRDDDPSE